MFVLLRFWRFGFVISGLGLEVEGLVAVIYIYVY